MYDSKKKRERGLSFDLVAKRHIHPHEEVSNNISILDTTIIVLQQSSPDQTSRFLLIMVQNGKTTGTIIDSHGTSVEASNKSIHVNRKTTHSQDACSGKRQGMNGHVMWR